MTTIKIFPFSDMHASHINSDKNFNYFKKESLLEGFAHLKDVDIAVAAGDIGEGLEGVIILRTMLECFPNLEIVYTPGNHEYYCQNIDKLNAQLNYLNGVSDRLHILDNSHIFIHEIHGIRFIGATLWTDFNQQNPNIMNAVQSKMNDYKVIRSGAAFKPVTTDRILQEHYIHRKRIFSLLNKQTKPCIVVTHHVPHMPTNNLIDPITYGYCSDLTMDLDVCGHLPEYWICGHTHRSHVHTQQYTNGAVTFVSNQIGYPSEGYSGYSEYCVLEVDNGN